MLINEYNIKNVNNTFAFLKCLISECNIFKKTEYKIRNSETAGWFFVGLVLPLHKTFYAKLGRYTHTFYREE